MLALLVSWFGLKVNPLVKGLDAVRNKPFSQCIAEETKVNPDGKWIALNSTILPEFMIANGAKTYNSTNFIPNLELWKKIDPKGEFNEVYNRYAHMVVELTDEDTSAELLFADALEMHLDVDDLDVLDIEYIVSGEEISGGIDDFDEVYNEYNIIVYKRGY